MQRPAKFRRLGFTGLSAPKKRGEDGRGRENETVPGKPNEPTIAWSDATESL